MKLWKIIPMKKRLWELSAIKFNLSTAEIQSISEYRKRKFTKPNKLAIFAVDDLAFGEMRQFEFYREEQGKASSGPFEMNNKLSTG